MNRNHLGSDGKLRCGLPKMVLINPQTVELSPFNPDSRTTESALKELETEMEKVGYVSWATVLVDNKGVVRDGHRRVQVAKQWGYVAIPATVIDGPDPENAWVIMNGVGKKSLTQKERAAACLENLSAVCDYESGKYIKEIERLGGDDLLRFVVIDSNRSPIIVAYAQKFAKHASEYEGTLPKYVADRSHDEYVKKTLRWLCNHKGAQGIAESAVSGKVKPKRIKSWIDGNKAPKITVT